MKKKKLSPEQQLRQYTEQLTQTYDRWQYCHDFGCSDPTWSDGINLNLLRNHTFYYRQKIDKLCEENGFPLPEIYSKPELPEMPKGYMARTDEIRTHAKDSLKCYEADSDYLYLLDIVPELSREVTEKVYLAGAMGYASSLRRAIEDNDLVVMRQHEKPDCYLDSIHECAKKLRSVLLEPDSRENVQMTLFI